MDLGGPPRFSRPRSLADPLLVLVRLDTPRLKPMRLEPEIDRLEIDRPESDLPESDFPPRPILEPEQLSESPPRDEYPLLVRATPRTGELLLFLLLEPDLRLSPPTVAAIIKRDEFESFRAKPRSLLWSLLPFRASITLAQRPSLP